MYYMQAQHADVGNMHMPALEAPISTDGSDGGYSPASNNGVMLMMDAPGSPGTGPSGPVMMDANGFVQCVSPSGGMMPFPGCMRSYDDGMMMESVMLVPAMGMFQGMSSPGMLPANQLFVQNVPALQLTMDGGCGIATPETSPRDGSLWQRGHSAEAFAAC